MIVRKRHEIIAIVRKGKVITEMRKGLTLIWQAVRSCFGSGGWMNDKPWLNDEGWKN